MIDTREITISRPKKDDVQGLEAFFTFMLHDTFQQNNIYELTETLNEEITDKSRCLRQDLESQGIERYFLIASYQESIIGTVEYGRPNELINACTNNKLKDIPEIGTVFIHPRFQKIGLVNVLLKRIFSDMIQEGYSDFSFDSGYPIAQKVWIKKFGQPQYFLENYWGEGAHHMVWHLSLEEALSTVKGFNFQEEKLEGGN